jgi:hypothetical protein
VFVSAAAAVHPAVAHAVSWWVDTTEGGVRLLTDHRRDVRGPFRLGDPLVAAAVAGVFAGSEPGKVLSIVPHARRLLSPAELCAAEHVLLSRVRTIDSLVVVLDPTPDHSPRLSVASPAQRMWSLLAGGILGADPGCAVSLCRLLDGVSAEMLDVAVCLIENDGRLSPRPVTSADVEALATARCLVPVTSSR